MNPRPLSITSEHTNLSVEHAPQTVILSRHQPPIPSELLKFPRITLLPGIQKVNLQLRAASLRSNIQSSKQIPNLIADVKCKTFSIHRPALRPTTHPLRCARKRNQAEAQLSPAEYRKQKKAEQNEYFETSNADICSTRWKESTRHNTPTTLANETKRKKNEHDLRIPSKDSL